MVFILVVVKTGLQKYCDFICSHSAIYQMWILKILKTCSVILIHNQIWVNLCGFTYVMAWAYLQILLFVFVSWILWLTVSGYWTGYSLGDNLCHWNVNFQHSISPYHIQNLIFGSFYNNGSVRYETVRILMVQTMHHCLQICSSTHMKQSSFKRHWRVVKRVLQNSSI